MLGLKTTRSPHHNFTPHSFPVQCHIIPLPSRSLTTQTPVTLTHHLPVVQYPIFLIIHTHKNTPSPSHLTVSQLTTSTKTHPRHVTPSSHPSPQPSAWACPPTTSNLNNLINWTVIKLIIWYLIVESNLNTMFHNHPIIWFRLFKTIIYS